MTGSVSEPFEERFPGFDTVSQRNHWDPVTAGVVLSRLGKPPDVRFFTPAEHAIALALTDRLLGQHPEDRIPVVNLIDARLAENQTDGWHYEDMPEDAEAWRASLAALDDEAHDRFGAMFAACSAEQQCAIIQDVQDLGSDHWHGMPARPVWSLWTRYACTAYYAHPRAWDEIGFPGPAYPRGYKNPGIDAREPFEVPDAKPYANPVEEDG